MVSAPTTNTFKNRLDKYWSNQSLMYEDHKTTIIGSGDLKIDDDMVAVSFVVGGNLNTWRKPPICCKSRSNFIT
jgi:hypothetical protein